MRHLNFHHNHYTTTIKCDEDKILARKYGIVISDRGLHCSSKDTTFNSHKIYILGEISKFSELLDHEVCSRGVVNRHNNVLSENYNI